MYKLIYQFSSFKFSCNLMQWWDKIFLSVNPRSIEILSALVGLLIPHTGGLPVAQPVLRRTVVFLLGTLFLIAVVACTYLTTERFLLMLIILYVRTLCLTTHQPFFSYYVFHLITP